MSKNWFKKRKCATMASENKEFVKKRRDGIVNWVTLGIIFVLLTCIVSSCLVFMETCSSDLKHELANEEWYKNTCYAYLQSHIVDTISIQGVYLRKSSAGVDTLRNCYILTKPEVDRFINGQK